MSRREQPPDTTHVSDKEWETVLLSVETGPGKAKYGLRVSKTEFDALKKGQVAFSLERLNRSPKNAPLPKRRETVLVGQLIGPSGRLKRPKLFLVMVHEISEDTITLGPREQL